MSRRDSRRLFPRSPSACRPDANRVKCSEPAIWPEPDQKMTSTDDRYGAVTVLNWHGLHLKLGRRGHCAGHEQPLIVAGTVVRVEVEHLPKLTSRTKRTLYLWVAGPDPDIAWRGYLRRFGIEHTYRFAKNTLGWTTPRRRPHDQRRHPA